MRRCLFLLLVGSMLPTLLLLAQPATNQRRQQPEVRLHADTAQIRRLNDLASKLLVSDIPQALLAAQKAYTLARQIHYTEGELQALLSLSASYRRQANFNQARRHANQARRLAVRHRWQAYEAKTDLQLSLVDMLLGDLAAALSWALKGLPLAEQARDLKTQSRLQYTIGTVYYQMADYEAARPMLLTALQHARALSDQQAIGSILNSLGNLHQAQEQWPPAQAYYQQAMDLARRTGDLQTETSSEINLAEVYRQQGKRVESLAHGRHARANADAYNLPAAELLLARTFLQEQRPDSAIRLAHHALTFYQQAGSHEASSGAADLLARSYASLGKYAQAYHYQELFVSYQDSLAGEAVQRKTAALRYGYELDKKKARITLLEKTRQLEAQKSARQRQQLYALLSGVGGLVLIAGLLWRNAYLKQRTNRYLSEKNTHIARQRDDLNQALTELKATQYQLAQREKMALLGELTAGVAHEIQNPLNFVNNFSEVSTELLSELRQEIDKETLSADTTQLVQDLLHDLSESQLKIQHHGQRADAIVRNMLEHARHHAGELRSTDLNALIEQSLRLAYSPQLANSSAGPIALTTSLDPQVGMVDVMPQDLSRVLLHLFNNAFYAVRQRQQTDAATYQPAVVVSTHRLNGRVEIRVRDNGSGIPAKLLEKIFQPFFTTKPPGKGTGLGLSLSYDIISKGHHGTIRAESQEGEYAQLVVSLPADVSKASPEPARGSGTSAQRVAQS